MASERGISRRGFSCAARLPAARRCSAAATSSRKAPCVPQHPLQRRGPDRARAAPRAVADVAGARIHRGRHLAGLQGQRLDAIPTIRPTSARGERLRRLAAEGRRPGRAAAIAVASPICAPCRRARRSPATTASKAGAASANGPACSSAPLLQSVGLKPEARYRRLPLRRHDWRTSTAASYYESIDLDGRLPPADDPRLRHERRDADRSPTARRCACASSASSATRWRSTSCASRRSTASPIGGGNGGFWEDRGYEWYAGI